MSYREDTMSLPLNLLNEISFSAGKAGKGLGFSGSKAGKGLGFSGGKAEKFDAGFGSKSSKDTFALASKANKGSPAVGEVGYSDSAVDDYFTAPMYAEDMSLPLNALLNQVSFSKAGKGINFSGSKAEKGNFGVDGSKANKGNSVVGAASSKAGKFIAGVVASKANKGASIIGGAVDNGYTFSDDYHPNVYGAHSDDDDDVPNMYDAHSDDDADDSLPNVYGAHSDEDDDIANIYGGNIADNVKPGVTSKAGKGISLNAGKSGKGISLNAGKSGKGISLNAGKAGKGASLNAGKAGKGVSLNASKSSKFGFSDVAASLFSKASKPVAASYSNNTPQSITPSAVTEIVTNQGYSAEVANDDYTHLAPSDLRRLATEQTKTLRGSATTSK